MAGRDVTTNNNDDDSISHRISFFHEPKKQFIYTNLDMLEVYPNLPYDDNTESYQFDVTPCEHFLDLKGTTLEFRTKIQQKDTNATTWSDLPPIAVSEHQSNVTSTVSQSHSSPNVLHTVNTMSKRPFMSMMGPPRQPLIGPELPPPPPQRRQQQQQGPPAVQTGMKRKLHMGVDEDEPRRKKRKIMNVGGEERPRIKKKRSWSQVDREENQPARKKLKRRPETHWAYSLPPQLAVAKPATQPHPPQPNAGFAGVGFGRRMNMVE